MSIYPQVKLKKTRGASRVLSGHCWVYSNEIDTSKQPLSPVMSPAKSLILFPARINGWVMVILIRIH